MERGRIPPVKTLKGQHGRLRPRARQNPGRYRRQLSAPEFFGRESTLALLGGQTLVQEREHRRVFGCVEADGPESALEISEPPSGGRVGAAEPQAAPFHDRMQRRIL